MSIIWAFQNSDTITKQNWDTHAIWILIWFYLFLVLALLMLLFPSPSSLCSYFPVNGISWEGIPGCCQPNPKAAPWPPWEFWGAAATSEFSIISSGLCSWSSWQTGKPLADASGPVLCSSKATSPDFDFCIPRMLPRTFCWLCLGSNTPRAVCTPLQVQDRIPELPQPGEEHRSQGCVCSAAGASPKPWEAEMPKLWPAFSSFFWGFCGKPPALSHLNSSTEAPQTNLSSSVPWRVWSSKLFIKNTHLIISKRKLKDAQGQSVNRKGGLNSPNTLFADWIIHEKSRARLEGFDWAVSSPGMGGYLRTWHFLRHHFSTRCVGEVSCPWHQPAPGVRGKAIKKPLKLVYPVPI